MKTQTFALVGAAALGLTASATLAVGETFTINVDGVQSWDSPGSPNNETFVIDVAAELGYATGTPFFVTGAGWDVTIDTLGGPSWLSEAQVFFDNDAVAGDYGDDWVSLAPGAGDSYAGVGTYSSNGIIKFENYGIPSIELADGLLYLEFAESFDDSYGVVDAEWSGTITVQALVIPAPAAAAVFGLAGLVGSRRRRA